MRDGLLSLQHGQVQDARESLEQASKLDSQNAFIWSSLAEVYWRLKESALASSAALEAERIGADNPVVCHALAKYYSETGNFAEAAKLENVFAQSSEADSGALSRAAELYLRAGQNKPALTLAFEAQRRVGSAPNEDLLGQALLANGQAKEAASHLESAWKVDNTNPQIAFDWVQFLLKTGGFAGAADAANTVLAVHPQDPQMVLALGVARYGQRRFDDAIAAFLKVIRMEPQVEQPYLFLGRMLDQAGTHLAEITRLYGEWAARDPQNARAKLLLAKALLATDDKDSQVEPLLRSSMTLNNADWEAPYELGRMLSSRHKYSEAAEQLERSIQLAPKEPEPHYHLARVYDRLGKSERAKAERELHAKLAASGSGDHGAPH